jgi:glycosyltransferase involved in cell wall biosynthesis
LRLLHVGSNAFYKNVEAIIQAIPLLRRRLDDRVTFIKVGERFTPAQRELIEKLAVSDAVKHLGWVPDDELPSVYAAADVLLMPSLLEGFGLPVLEAMAASTPVVASNRGSLPEVVGDAALLVGPEDVEAFADAVVRLFTDTLLRTELISRGFQRAQQFTWDRAARAILDVYRSVDAEATGYVYP